MKPTLNTSFLLIRSILTSIEVNYLTQTDGQHELEDSSPKLLLSDRRNKWKYFGAKRKAFCDIKWKLIFIVANGGF